MEKNIDLRISRTDKMIREAFLELMSTIGFEKISIKNLTEKALISRTTFYLHYEDKYDLLNQIENEILDNFKNIASDLPFDEMVKEGLSNEKVFSLLLRVYEYIKENQQFFRLIISNNGSPSFFYKLNETIKITIPNKIFVENLRMPENYLIAIISSIQTSIITEWLKSGMKETPEEIVSIITQVMNDVPKNIYKIKGAVALTD